MPCNYRTAESAFGTASGRAVSRAATYAIVYTNVNRPSSGVRIIENQSPRQRDELENKKRMLAGAGGEWPVINEKRDAACVKQFDNTACAQMLLKEQGLSASQRQMAKLIADSRPASLSELGSLSDYESLSAAMNAAGPSNVGWRGGYVNPKQFHALIGTGSWAAMMRDPAAGINHWVVVDGVNGTGEVMIRDPWEGTSYSMTKEAFNQFWTGHVVFGQ